MFVENDHIFHLVRKKFFNIVNNANSWNKRMIVKARPLETEEAI